MNVRYKRYTVGLLFDGDRVLLLKKKRGPETVIGKWNGPGGKVVIGEGQVVAMRREFREETGTDVKNWKLQVLLVNPDEEYEIYFFFADWEAGMDMPRTATDELVRWRNLNRLHEIEMAPHLGWVIPMCLDPSLKTTSTIRAESSNVGS